MRRRSGAGEHAPERGGEDVEMQLGRVLAELGAVIPAEGFGARLVTGLTAEASRREAKPMQRPWGVFPQRWTAVAVVLLVAGLGISAVLRRGRELERGVPLPRAEVRRPERSLVAGGARAQAAEAGLRDEENGAPGRARAGLASESFAARREGRGMRTEVALAGRETRTMYAAGRLSASAVLDRAAAADSAAPSLVAPPLPPTAQERRVQLMLRHGERRDLAELDPVKSVLAAGQEKAEQRAFFDPPRVEVDPFGGLLR